MTGGAEVGRAFARGLIAAMAMSGLRKVTTGLGLVEQIPPERVALEGVPALVRRIPPERRDVVVELAHWGYGGVGGAAFGLLPELVRRQGWAGPLYGTAVWLGYELAVAPILGLHRQNEPSLAERAALVADHVLYGAVVAGSAWPHEA
ncbi:MAG: DUF1440 domain-containing protein [Gaiellaceae bacterium MAG52_C11]|nr:DUF1440 domain-containing protein [Candidatus Gaiellasilicea maunaloa]